MKKRANTAAKPQARRRRLDQLVRTPRSDESCADAEVWASRNPKWRVVPYRLAARMERELAEAIAERDSESRWADKYAAEVERLDSAIRACLRENAHLADGDNCTLAGLKRAICGSNPTADHRATEKEKAHE